MILWGESIDPSKAELFELPDKLSPLPPHPTESSNNEPSRTKTYAKPTAFLPTDHAQAAGETHKPAFPSQDEAASADSVDEGSSHLFGELFQDNVWFVVAFGVVFVAIGFVIFLHRRLTKKGKHLRYVAVPREATAMSALDRRSPVTEASYHAVGDASDDEDADEHMGLVRQTNV